MLGMDTIVNNTLLSIENLLRVHLTCSHNIYIHTYIHTYMHKVTM